MLEVYVSVGEPFERALRRFKKKCEKAGSCPIFGSTVTVKHPRPVDLLSHPSHMRQTNFSEFIRGEKRPADMEPKMVDLDEAHYYYSAGFSDVDFIDVREPESIAQAGGQGLSLGLWERPRGPGPAREPRRQSLAQGVPLLDGHRLG